jgi:hypothetical protein
MATFGLRYSYDDRGFADQDDLQLYRTTLDTLNLLDFYNNNGLYSRKMATNFLGYHFSKAGKTNPFRITSTGWSFTTEPELKKQFARLVLNGSPYYREMAATYSDILIEKRRVGARASRTAELKLNAIENLELMVRICNDLELIHAARQLIQQHKRLQNKSYLPELELLSMEGDTLSPIDFSGDKPTVFYLSSSWTGDRYNYDDLAKENPDIQFVMVVEGTSFEYWKSYTQRAEPVAKQLFLSSDTSTFNELFHKNSTLFVLDKNGQLEGYARSLPGAVEMAKTSTALKKKN